MRTLALACALLGPAPAVPPLEDALRTVDYTGLAPRTSSDLAAAKAWRRPAGVGFELEGGATREGTFVVVAGWLTNATDAPQTVVLFPVGSRGLSLLPAPGRAERLPPRPGEPPLALPAPPPPEVVTLPPRSRVRFRCGLDLSRYAWLGGQEPALEWSFQFWDEPKPRGLLPLP